jgi:hypothetical protein
MALGTTGSLSEGLIAGVAPFGEGCARAAWDKIMCRTMMPPTILVARAIPVASSKAVDSVTRKMNVLEGLSVA